MSLKYIYDDENSIGYTELAAVFDTGCNPSVNVKILLQKIENRVQIYIPIITSAAGLAAPIQSTTTLLPKEYRPIRNIIYLTPIIDAATNGIGAIQIATTGLISFYSSPVALADFTAGAAAVGTMSDLIYTYSTI